MIFQVLNLHKIREKVYYKQNKQPEMDKFSWKIFLIKCWREYSFSLHASVKFYFSLAEAYKQNSTSSNYLYLLSLALLALASKKVHLSQGFCNTGATGTWRIRDNESINLASNKTVVMPVFSLLCIFSLARGHCHTGPISISW